MFFIFWVLNQKQVRTARIFGLDRQQALKTKLQGRPQITQFFQKMTQKSAQASMVCTFVDALPVV